MIFVFGSNLAGRHGSGAAEEAQKQWGAQWGVGVGPTGSAYAIPTKDEDIRSLPLPVIAVHVRNFIAYARANPDKYFVITRVGCGLAGYGDHQIAPLFFGVPENCHIPAGWSKYIFSAGLAK